MREFVDRIHFVGIGGIGMSGIAEVLLELGFTVSGSDHRPGATTARLERAGASVFAGHAAEHIADADVVVTSAAIADDNVELAAARRRQIPVIPRAEMLGELMRFRRGICVAGTHGKTTTTSLVFAVLAAGGLDPTLVVGGVVESEHRNARLGAGEYMVVEADESDASFLHLKPQVAVMTNIDADHLETYGGSVDRLRDTCLAFLHTLPFYGLAVLCLDDPLVREVAAALHKPVVSYGFGAGLDFRAVDFRQVGGVSHFAVERDGVAAGEFQLALPGRHNVLNALAAIAVASRLRVDDAAVARALAEFSGIGRRFQVLGEVALSAGDGGDSAASGTIELVDDYAHHPAEIAATLCAARDCWPERRLVVVFQPHRYTRTRDLFDDFVRVLATVESLVITSVYAAGEPPLKRAGGRALCRALRVRGREVVFAENRRALRQVLPNLLRADDVLLTLGAGDIGRFARTLVTDGLRRGVAA